MVEVSITSLTPSTPPDDGWKVDYRIKDSVGAYITPVGSPFTALPIEFTTTDPAGTLYEVRVWRDCGDLESTKFTLFTPCTCTGSGYVPNEDQTGCKKTTTIAPTISESGYCLAASTNGAYSNYGSRIYRPGFSNTTLNLAPGTVNTYIYGNMILADQWGNASALPFTGPMNRRAVWIDSDCDGNRNALAAGVQTTIAFMYNNIGLPRTVYVGIAADNNFKLIVNGVQIVETLSGGDMQFKMFHIVPVNLVKGVNYFNGVATGDGSINDAIAMVGFDNTAAQIQAATTDSALNVMFDSINLRGEDYEVATCPPTYSLDVSSGVGNYICVKIETKGCNTAS